MYSSTFWTEMGQQLRILQTIVFDHLWNEILDMWSVAWSVIRIFEGFLIVSSLQNHLNLRIAWFYMESPSFPLNFSGFMKWTRILIRHWLHWIHVFAASPCLSRCLGSHALSFDGIWVPSGNGWQFNILLWKDPPFLMGKGKSTISMAIFNSYVSHYQRVSPADEWPFPAGLGSGHTVSFLHLLWLGHW